MLLQLDVTIEAYLLCNVILRVQEPYKISQRADKRVSKINVIGGPSLKAIHSSDLNENNQAKAGK